MPPDASWTKVDVDHADCLFMHEVGPGSALSHVSCCFRAGGPAGYSAKNYPPGVHAAGSSTSGDSAARTRVTFLSVPCRRHLHPSSMCSTIRAHCSRQLFCACGISGIVWVCVYVCMYVCALTCSMHQACQMIVQISRPGGFARPG